MTMEKLASDLIRAMRASVKTGTNGGFWISSEDAIAWEKQLTTALAAVEEMEAENVMLGNALEARMRAAERGGRPRLALVSDNGDGGDAA